MARSGTDRQDRQRHLVATSQSPGVRDTLLRPGSSWGALALALHCPGGRGVYSLVVV